MSKRLLLLTSGGDSPGMNAAIRAVVRSGHYNGLEVLACHDGYQGLIEQKIFPMDNRSVGNCIQRGGTIIRSNRALEFHQKAVRDACRYFLADQNIAYLVVIGGDGTYRGAALLANEGGPRTIGIPGTIDNDIVGTEYTIGFDTARNNALQAIDKIRDTATSNSFYFLVETMGRNSGFLAVDVGLAGGADYIMVPEFPIATKDLATKITAPQYKKQSLIIVIAEADHPGRSFTIAHDLKQLASDFEYRVCVLGHIQRGGTPTVMDRVTASIMGNMAVEALLAGKSKCMTAIQNGSYILTPFPDPYAPSRVLTNDSLLKLASVLTN